MNEEKQPLVFIVDDDEMYSMMLDYTLSNECIFRFKRFATGEECIDSLNMHPMLIILDYCLPGMDGLQVIREIKKYDAGIPVVVITGNHNKHAALEFLKLGVNDYLLKEKGTAIKIIRLLNSFLSRKVIPPEEDKPAFSGKLIAGVILVLLLIVFAVIML